MVIRPLHSPGFLFEYRARPITQKLPRSARGRGAFIYIGQIMPHTPQTLTMCLEFYRQHKTPVDIVLFLLAGLFVRLFYWGGHFREACGDLLVGLAVMTFVYTRMPNLIIEIPGYGSITVGHIELAFALGISGYKGFKEVVFLVLKKRFGIDIRARRVEKQNNNQPR
nr:hypothetical protein [Salmonella enterica]